MFRRLLGLLRLVPCSCGHAAAVHEPPDDHAIDGDGCGCWLLVLMLVATICAVVVIRVWGCC